MPVPVWKVKRDGIPTYRGPGIERITCLLTKKIYIGSAENIYRRIKDHRNLLRKNKHPNIFLQRAWNKYREEAFVFDCVDVCEEEELIVLEQQWLDKTQCYDQRIGYNICKVAGSRYGTTHSAETIAKISAKKKGKKLSEETRKAMSEAQKRRYEQPVPEENKENIKKAHWSKGPNAKEIAEKIASKNRGTKRSEDTREKISEAKKGNFSYNIGRVHTPEAIARMTEARRKRAEREREAKRQELLRLMKEQNG